MKKTYKLRSLLLTGLFAFTAITAQAELLLNENFDYTATTLLNNGTWVAYGSNPNAPIQLLSQGLTYNEYQNTPVTCWLN